jgi:hypothetical protein
MHNTETHMIYLNIPILHVFPSHCLFVRFLRLVSFFIHIHINKSAHTPTTWKHTLSYQPFLAFLSFTSDHIANHTETYMIYLNIPILHFFPPYGLFVRFLCFISFFHLPVYKNRTTYIHHIETYYRSSPLLRFFLSFFYTDHIATT